MQTNRAVPPQGKVVYYRSDGSGRDTYIRQPNGGLLSKDNLHRQKQYKPPHQKQFTFQKGTYGRHPSSYISNKSNKFVHYISDGSGRDYYVGSNEGGNSHPHRWRNQTQFYFRNTLRNNAKINNIDPQSTDIFQKSQSKFTGTQQKFHRTMSSFQGYQSRRLSQHKKSPMPPPISTYFDPNFNTTREFRKKQYGLNH